MLKIIFQDDYLLVVNKSAGIVVDQSQTNKEPTLTDLLKKEFNIQLFRGGIVHRLDKDTSGVLLVAKTQKALENLQNQFKERKIKKEYLALVHGYVMESGRVEAAIMRNPRNREKFIVLEGFTSKESKLTFEASTGGREAVTEYEPVKLLVMGPEFIEGIFADFNKIQMRKLERQKYGEFTLLSCKPQTGRTHQIRVHLKYINHPIVADGKYAGRKMVRLDRRWCPRMFLHAAKIGFEHPVSREWMEFESPLPKDLKEALDQLKVQS